MSHGCWQSCRRSRPCQRRESQSFVMASGLCLLPAVSSRGRGLYRNRSFTAFSSEASNRKLCWQAACRVLRCGNFASLQEHHGQTRRTLCRRRCRMMQDATSRSRLQSLLAGAPKRALLACSCKNLQEASAAACQPGGGKSNCRQLVSEVLVHVLRSVPLQMPGEG